jgi:RNA polymerase sigma-70 factor, ECF subfamily
LVSDDDVARRFAAACVVADDDTLELMLAADAVLVVDGGGAVLAPLHPIRGAAHAVAALRSLLTTRPEAILSVESVNGHPGLVLRDAGQAAAVVALRIVDTLIVDLWIVLNPAKLAAWHHRDPPSG